MSIKSKRQWITERKTELMVNSKDLPKWLDIVQNEKQRRNRKNGSYESWNLTGKWCAQKRIGSTGDNHEGLERPKFEATIKLEIQNEDS